MDMRVDPNVENDYAIRKAAENGHLAIVNCILRDSRFKPGYPYTICLASKNGHIAVIDRLLRDPRVDPTTLSWSDKSTLELATGSFCYCQTPFLASKVSIQS